VKTYNRQPKSKKITTLIKKLINESDSEESYEDHAAAHFVSDSSKYSTKIHPHYNGNNNFFNKTYNLT